MIYADRNFLVGSQFEGQNSGDDPILELEADIKFMVLLKMKTNFIFIVLNDGSLVTIELVLKAELFVRRSLSMVFGTE